MRYLIYILIIFLLAGGIWLLNRQDNSRGLSASWETDFAIKDTQNITKIYLDDRGFGKILLQKTASGWTLNDSMKASPPRMEITLSTLNQITIKSPVPKTILESVIRELAGKGVKVEVYMKEAKTPNKTLYIGGPTPDHTGTYVILEKEGKMASTPFIAYIPGFIGFLSSRFETGIADWRDRVLFRLPPESISSVKLDYPQNPVNSFEIVQTGSGQLLLRHLIDGSVLEEDEINVNAAKLFLNGFEKLACEAFENDYSKRDSIVQTLPAAILTVKKKQGKEQVLTVFYKPLDKRTKEQFEMDGTPKPYDTDRFFALANDGKDFVIIQQVVFDKIFRRHTDFIRQAL